MTLLTDATCPPRILIASLALLFVAGLTTSCAHADVLTDACPANPELEQQSTQILVDDANRYADIEQRLKAICRYKIATLRLPDNITLKNNLGVLTFNYAMTLTDEGNFTDARQWLLASKQLTPGNNKADEAIAITYVQEALLRQRSDTNPDWLTYDRLLRQAISIQPESPVYQQHLARMLTNWGGQLAKQGQFDQAALKLNEAMQLNPEHPAIQRSLADVNLQQAKQLPIGSEQQKQRLDRATQLDPTLADTAKRIAKGEAILSQPNTALLDTQPDTAAQLSIGEKIEGMEDFLGIATAETAQQPLPDRLDTIEEQLYGKAKKGGLIERTETAYHSLVGSGQSLENSPTELTVKVETIEGTYLYPILKNTSGRVIRWAKFPLALHIQSPEDTDDFWQQIPLSKPQTLKAIQDGINQWVWATHQFVSVVWVDDPATADVAIELSEKPYTDRFTNPETSLVLPEYTLPKASKLAKALGLASMFAPGYYGIAPKVGAAALRYNEAKKIERVREESTMTLAPNVMTTPAQLANAAAYEFGHVLGLKGASPVSEDILHPSTPAETELIKAISEQDKATLKALYERPASIILNLQ
jgi:predicted Zn-dependent protease/tetratricopeptide (TPR) repeat protein